MSSRRQFLQHSALLGSGLALACFLPTRGDSLPRVRKPVPAPLPPGAEPGLQPHVLLRIDTQGHITLVSKVPEMGQGVKTSLPMLIAEELEADWRAVQVVQADFDAAYGPQTAGGSQSVPQHFDAFLRLGAMARTLLVQAAADTWQVPVSACHAKLGVVHHAPSGRQLRYGELATRADKLPLPDAASVALKPAASRSLLGTRVPGVDNAAIVTGQRLFGIDVALPGMLHACYVKAPAFGARVRQANLDEVKRQPGVRDAFVIDGEAQGQDLQGLMPGVAIVAESTWAAQRARRTLQVSWDEGPHLAVTREHWAEHLRQAQVCFDGAAAPGSAQTNEAAKIVRRDGDVAQALAQAAHRIEATYQHPFLPHATLEPQNATAWWQGGRIELWAPIQHPAGGVYRVARLLGIAQRKVTLHLTRCGGGFGRRLGADYLLEAAAIARRVSAPVKLTWSREDDLQHDHYRAGGMHRLRGGVDAQGRLSAWEQRAVGFANPAQRDGTGPLEPGPGTLLGGDEFPAGLVPHGLWMQHTLATGVPLGAWRSPGSNVFAWVSQSFLDELAHAAGQDPLAFRLALLSGPGAHAQAQADIHAQRQRTVLQTAAQAAGWGTPLPSVPGLLRLRRGRGIASHSSQGGHAAMVVDVSVDAEGQLRVDRVVAAVDVGEQIVNLSGAEQQVQGAVVDGLSALWRQGLDIEAGRIVQSNFHDHPLLRLPDAPARIDVHFVRSPHPSTGLGEPALPPVAPAVCNAIFAATGVRIRDWPLLRTPLR